jgi:multicomponent Na+:H+ antiporter subunit E
VNLLLWNVFLALAWAALTAEFRPANLGIGFLVGYLILFFSQPVVGRSNYFLKVWQLVVFLLYFLWEMIRASVRVAHDVLTPTIYSRPGVVAVPLDARTDEEITLLANLITLTPGTVSLDVSEDRRVLYVHGMFIDDLEAFRRDLKMGLERRLLEAMR